ncbi:MAG: DnaD domain protein [bacterium]
MLKYMIKKGYVDVNKLILDIYPKMNLTEQEVIVVLNLIELYKNNQSTLAVSSLSKKLNMSNDVCSNSLNGLLNKGYISLNIEYTKSGKAKEVFDIDDIVTTISKMMNEEIKTEKIHESENLIKIVIDFLEKTLNKSLSPFELDLVLSWIDDGETLDSISKAVDISVSKGINNLKYIDKVILGSKNNPDAVVDEESSKVLDDIFRNLK